MKHKISAVNNPKINEEYEEFTRLIDSFSSLLTFRGLNQNGTVRIYYKLAEAPRRPDTPIYGGNPPLQEALRVLRDARNCFNDETSSAELVDVHHQLLINLLLDYP